MNIEETARLCKTVRAVAPAQKFEPETPIAWQLLLVDVTYDEAVAALTVVAREQAFIAPSDLIRQVRLDRKAGADRRRSELHAGAVPDADPDDDVAYRRALREGRFRTAPGEPRPAAALVAHVAALLPRS